MYFVVVGKEWYMNCLIRKWLGAPNFGAADCIEQKRDTYTYILTERRIPKMEKLIVRLMVACFVASIALAPVTLLAGEAEKKAEGEKAQGGKSCVLHAGTPSSRLSISFAFSPGNGAPTGGGKGRRRRRSVARNLEAKLRCLNCARRAQLC